MLGGVGRAGWKPALIRLRRATWNIGPTIMLRKRCVERSDLFDALLLLQTLDVECQADVDVALGRVVAPRANMSCDTCRPRGRLLG
jgi:hypothetical protein